MLKRLLNSTFNSKAKFLRCYKTATNNYDFREDKNANNKTVYGDQKTHFVQNTMANRRVRGDTKL